MQGTLAIRNREPRNPDEWEPAVKPISGGGRSCREDACQAPGENRESGYCGSRGRGSCDMGNPVAPTGIR
jgi:hypothetical protein